MISIIIPTYNEETQIGETIKRLRENGNPDFITEIIISDGQSTDNTVAMAGSEGIKTVISPKKGRAAQMNYGAGFATGEILYFLHADSVPPPDYSVDIEQAVEQGFEAGCYRLVFDHDHWFLKANCWFTRFNINAFHYGDQSLFITRNLFEKVEGFNENYIVFEDLDMIRRIRNHAKFKIFKKNIVTSARKYVANGVFKMQMIFYLMYFLERSGMRQERLVRMFRRMVKQDKI